MKPMPASDAGSLPSQWPLPPGEDCPPLRSIGAWLQATTPSAAVPAEDVDGRDEPAQSWVAALAGLAADLAVGRTDEQRSMLAQTVATVARAQLAGHAGWPLQAWAPAQRAAVQSLLEQGAGVPWLRCDFGLVALARSAELEARLASALAERQRLARARDDDPAFEAYVHDAQARGLTEEQARAVAAAACFPLAIISGGPGTGKTTCIAVLLELLAKHRPEWRVALAAPTGKAAARMRESLQARQVRLQADADTDGTDDAEDAPARPWVGTIHRLLSRVEVGPGVRMLGRDGWLPFDLLLIDESSMLDLELAARLAAALRPSTHWVWVGDSQQLAAVQFGVAFHALADPQADRVQRLLGACRNRLTRSHRFDPHSRLGRVAAAVAAGASQVLRHELSRAADIGRAWAQPSEAVPSATPPSDDDVDASLMLVEPGRLADGDGPMAERLIGPVLQATTAFAAGQHDPVVALRALRDYQLLTAMRLGPWGVERLNALFSHTLRPLSPKASGAWFVGRRIVVRQNQPGIGLANGDVGVVGLAADGSWVAWFDAGAGEVRAVPVAQLPRVDDAWALTVHMAQGSEYERVTVVLPQADSPLATREWLYTAITRARRQVVLWGEAAAVQAASGRGTERHNRLAERIEAVLNRP